MYKEGYLGTAKLFVASSFKSLDRTVHLVFLSCLADRAKIHCFATSKELRHTAKMLLEAADELDR